MLTLIPIMTELFDDSKDIIEKPIFSNPSSLTTYIENSMNYLISNNLERDRPLNTLLWMVAFVLSIFLLKNLFSYLAIVFDTNSYLYWILFDK